MYVLKLIENVQASHKIKIEYDAYIDQILLTYN